MQVGNMTPQMGRSAHVFGPDDFPQATKMRIRDVEYKAVPKFVENRKDGDVPETEEKLIVSFVGQKKVYECNVTNEKVVIKLFQEAGIEDTSQGLDVIMYREMQNNNKYGVKIRSANEAVVDQTGAGAASDDHPF